MLRIRPLSTMCITAIAALCLAGAATAQQSESGAPNAAQETPVALDENAAQGEPEINPDEMANILNSQQKIKQTYTIKREINGQVVETEKRTVTYAPGDPRRATEAGLSPKEAMKEAFDRELLTRTEAFEEAKLDFIVADVNRDNRMTAEEFARLVETWRSNEARTADAPDEETARQRQYRAFVAELDPEAAAMQAEARAKQKFQFMAGAADSISREDYLREYLLDFDTMDADDNQLLRGEELMHFRALNRGETVEM